MQAGRLIFLLKLTIKRKEISWQGLLMATFLTYVAFNLPGNLMVHSS